jgi:hypothetical protein
MIEVWYNQRHDFLALVWWDTWGGYYMCLGFHYDEDNSKIPPIPLSYYGFDILMDSKDWERIGDL